MPSSRHSSAAHSFSVRNESGPASTRQPSTNSERITPPKRLLDSNRTYSTTELRNFSKANAAESPDIPPPTIATLFMRRSPRLQRRSQSCSREFCQCRDQKRRIIQRLRTPQPHIFFFSELPEQNVDVVKHLDVIAQKTDRLHEHFGMPASL